MLIKPGKAINGLDTEKLLNCRTCGLHHLIFILHVKKVFCYWLLIMILTVTHRLKEEIHIKLHSNNINRDSRIESPEAWLPLIKKHSNRRSVRQRTSEAKAHTNNGVRNAPISAANNRPTRTRAWSHISSRVASRRRLARQGL